MPSLSQTLRLFNLFIDSQGKGLRFRQIRQDRIGLLSDIGGGSGSVGEDICVGV